jgi:hypothetical protein
VLRSIREGLFANVAITKEFNMFHKIAKTFVLAAGLLRAAHVTGVTSEARAQRRPVAPNGCSGLPLAN